jgi:hypothetical protein
MASYVNRALKWRAHRRGSPHLVRQALGLLLIASIAVQGLVLPAARAQTSVDSRSARGQALSWLTGSLPNLAEAARIALEGSDEDVAELVRGGYRAPLLRDQRAKIEEMVAAAGPALRDAADVALSGSDQGIQDFLDRGWQPKLEIDLRLRAAQAMASGGALVKAAAQSALQSGTTMEFLISRYSAAQEQDERLAVARLMTFGGSATQLAAQRVLSESSIPLAPPT